MGPISQSCTRCMSAGRTVGDHLDRGVGFPYSLGGWLDESAKSSSLSRSAHLGAAAFGHVRVNVQNSHRAAVGARVGEENLADRREPSFEAGDDHRVLEREAAVGRGVEGAAQLRLHGIRTAYPS